MQDQQLPMICTREAGLIVGETSPLEFTFVSSRELLPPRLEYLVVPGVEEHSGEALAASISSERVDVLAQVIDISIDSAILSERLTYEETLAILHSAYAPPPKMYGRARVIGYLAHGEVRIPRCAATPGTPVYTAADAFLRRFFSLDVASGVPVGVLINRPEVPVVLDPNGLRRHLAIIAQTGAGKSYLAGQLFESLLQLGTTVVIFDPNSDYVQLRKAAGQEQRPFHATQKTSFAEDIIIYRIPSVQGRRFADELIGPTEPFTVRFADLEPDEVVKLAGIAERATNIRAVVALACAHLQRRGVDYRPDELIAELNAMATGHDYSGGNAAADVSLAAGADEELRREDRRAARKAARYIEGLRDFAVWGYQDSAVEHLMQPQRLTIFDLASADKVVAPYAAERTLHDIWRLALSGQLHHPVLVVLEEAHNPVPADGRTHASRIINTIAAKGRKFRIFLTLITQRPSKISQDALSQRGSQIIMRLTNPDDQHAVQRASEAISTELLRDLPGLNKGEAIVLGQLTRVPVMMQVTDRASAEGGGDVDVVAELIRASQAAMAAWLAHQLHGQGTPARGVVRRAGYSFGKNLRKARLPLSLLGDWSPPHLFFWQYSAPFRAIARKRSGYQSVRSGNEQESNAWN
jgi:DNA helicase HerA-like ATPase